MFKLLNKLKYPMSLTTIYKSKEDIINFRDI